MKSLLALVALLGCSSYENNRSRPLLPDATTGAPEGAAQMNASVSDQQAGAALTSTSAFFPGGRSSFDGFLPLEVPPSLLPGDGGNWRQMFYSSAYTIMCHTNISSTSPVDKSYCQPATTAISMEPSVDSHTVYWKTPAFVSAHPQQWKLNYEGVYGATLRGTPGNQEILTINHAETKNERYYNGYTYISPILPPWIWGAVPGEAPDQSCSSGVFGPNSPYVDCYTRYAAFISASVGTYKAPEWGLGYLQPRGPIIWPQDGYWQMASTPAPPRPYRTSSGVRHPSLMVYKDGQTTYAYVFYVDTSLSSYGFKVARAPLSQASQSGSYKIWDGSDFNAPAMPAGVDPAQLAAHLSKKLPASTKLIFPNQGTPNRFSVAYVRDKGYFVGIEEWGDGTLWHLSLRTSKDLKKGWSAPTSLDSVVEPAPWNKFSMHYPVMADAGFSTNSEVDSWAVMIMGTSAQANARTIRLPLP